MQTRPARGGPGRPRRTAELLGAAALATAVLAVQGSVPVAAESRPSGDPTSASTTCPTPAAGVLRTPPGVGRLVALTFDDGPSRFTPGVLAVLKRARVHATFFVTGRHVAAYPGYARRIVAQRNLLGNHTWNHPQAVAGSHPYGSFDQLPLATMLTEVDRTTNEITKVTGTTPCYFRAPGGHDRGSPRVLRGRGLTAVNWSATDGGSAQPSRTTRAATLRLVRAATTHIGPRVILLEHDGKASAEPERVVSSHRGNTVAALPAIIRWYKRHGYAFVQPDGRPF